MHVLRTLGFHLLPLAFLFGLAVSERANASAYYSVTVLGDDADIKASSTGYYNTKTGLSYDFISRTTPITQADRAKAPTEQLYQGVATPIERTYTMQVYQTNDAGTIIGAMPSGLIRSEPESSLTYGYAVQYANGAYSDFKPLLMPTQWSVNGWGTLMLNQANQILLANPSGLGSSLLDLNTGTTTRILDLIPQDLLDKIQKAPDYGSYVNIKGFDDRGDILIRAPLNGNSDWKDFMLTPPGLAAPAGVPINPPPPTPTPEPASWMIFSLVVGVFGVRAAVRRRRKSIDSI